MSGSNRNGVINCNGSSAVASSMDTVPFADSGSLSVSQNAKRSDQLRSRVLVSSDGSSQYRYSMDEPPVKTQNVYNRDFSVVTRSGLQRLNNSSGSNCNPRSNSGLMPGKSAARCDVHQFPTSSGFCRSATEISCSTDMEFDTVIFNWKISNFTPLRRMAMEKGLPPEGDVLTSPVFLDNENSAWWLRLYPYEDREQHRGKVSLFLHTDRAQKGDIFFSFRFAALDSSSREIADTGGGSPLHKFGKSESIRNYGFYDFIKDDYTLERALQDELLWVYCEINIFTNPQTVVQDTTGIAETGSNLNNTPNPFGHNISQQQQYKQPAGYIRQASVQQ